MCPTWQGSTLPLETKPTGWLYRTGITLLACFLPCSFFALLPAANNPGTHSCYPLDPKCSLTSAWSILLRCITLKA